MMYVGVVELFRNLPLYGVGFFSPLIRDKSVGDTLSPDNRQGFTGPSERDFASQSEIIVR